MQMTAVVHDAGGAGNKQRRNLTMKEITIYPGSMAAIGQALNIFGERRVRPGAWNEPVSVNGLTEEEVADAVRHFTALGCEVKEVPRGTC
jgi:hypothetical protein